MPARSVSPERLNNSVGVVKSDLLGSPGHHFDGHPSGLNKHPKLNLKESRRKTTLKHTHPDIHTPFMTHTNIYVTVTNNFIERCLYTYSTL